MSKLIKKCFFLVICGGLLAIQPLSVHADPLDPYIQGAKKEGSVNIGITLRAKINGKSSGDRYIAAFQKRYPFIKANFKRIGGARERERVIGEMVGGIYNYDVAPVTETGTAMLIDAKLPRIVEWEKLGVPKFLIHPANMGIALRTQIFGIAYNRDLVSDQEAGAFTWETCADPKWKAKAAMDDGPRHLIPLLMEESGWGREKTLDFAKRWAANKPHIEHSRSTAAAKLMSGAYHIFCGAARTQIMDLQVYSDAKSIGIVYPDPVPLSFGDIIYVPDKTPHPNGGILFAAWTATQEAQVLLDEVNFTGHPSFEGTQIGKSVQGKKVVSASWDTLIRSDDVLADIIQAMGMPVVRSQTKKKK
ncbi:MAG: extracellular solute-binding protein [Desulfobacterales bacterium]|nr:extracellular solute-binding protein [Desulfobacterales bacterium]